MATLTRGYTFGATETVTNTKLHSLVDSGSISGIVDADIHASAAIANSKLAQITAASKVSGAALVSLPSIPSGAGTLPLVNHAASPAANRVFLTTDGSTGSWGQVALTSQISGALPIANGGTAHTTAQAALDALLPAQGGKAGQVLKTNATNGAWSSVAALETPYTMAWLAAPYVWTGTVSCTETTGPRVAPVSNQIRVGIPPIVGKNNITTITFATLTVCFPSDSGFNDVIIYECNLHGTATAKASHTENITSGTEHQIIDSPFIYNPALSYYVFLTGGGTLYGFKATFTLA